MSYTTRRKFLTISGTAVLGGFSGCLNDDTDTEYGWNTINSPTEKTLYDVVMSTEGPYAVGENGRVITRKSDKWKVVLEKGPKEAENRLSGAAVTTDGRHVWFAGESGAVGQHNVLSGDGRDYSAPQEKTSSWEDIAVIGQSGRERIYLLNGSGELLSGVNRKGEIEWQNVTKPGDSIDPTGITYINDTGYLCDTDGDVYKSTETDQWNRIGIESKTSAINDIAALDSQTANVVTGKGSILLYNGYNWLQSDTDGEGFRAIERRADWGIAVGTSGAIYELEETAWTKKQSSVSKTLYGTTLGTTDYASVAVGGNGTILERFQ